MTETTSTGSTNVTPTPSPPSFGADELATLDREDGEAGKVIAQLLCFFFLYTIVVMVIAAWWTWDAIQ